MAYDAITQRLISLKKLAGKAQTSNDKDLANEALPSGVTISSNTVFGQQVTSSPSSVTLYTITNHVEYLRFSSTFIAGSDTVTGRHGFQLSLPSDYESNSSNSKAGTYPFVNNQAINITSGSLQLIPTSFAPAYEAKPYYGGTALKDTGTQIPILDARDWYLDYFNGILFQQDPPGTGDHSENPDYVEAYLYIGEMLDSVVDSAAGGGAADKNAQFLVLSATGSLNAERVLTIGTGMSSSDAGAGGNYTLSIDNTIVATLTGSQFSGNIGITGSIGATLGLSGSLTRLANGNSYLVAGSNITISSSSNGQVTIASSGGGSSDPTMKIYEVTSSHDSSQPLVIPSIDFTSNSRSFNKNQIFLNGVLMASGSVLDYTLDLQATGSIVFNLPLKDDDVIIVRQS